MCKYENMQMKRSWKPRNPHRHVERSETSPARQSLIQKIPLSVRNDDRNPKPVTRTPY